MRGDVTTNTVESYFSVFKRGMRGVYQHCAEKHLHRYLAEFDFRYNNRIALGVNDGERAEQLAKGIVGKRLTYRRPHGAGSVSKAERFLRWRRKNWKPSEAQGETRFGWTLTKGSRDSDDSPLFAYLPS